MSPEDLLDEVVDRDSFIAFVRELAAERWEAERMEREDPVGFSTSRRRATGGTGPGGGIDL
jgi:hypothetical protein